MSLTFPISILFSYFELTDSLLTKLLVTEEPNCLHRYYRLDIWDPTGSTNLIELCSSHSLNLCPLWVSCGLSVCTEWINREEDFIDSEFTFLSSFLKELNTVGRASGTSSVPGLSETLTLFEDNNIFTRLWSDWHLI